MQASVFQVFSIGRVSDNKALGSSEIKAIPTETRFTVDEEVLTNPQQLETSYKTPSGQESVKGIIDNSITCTWLRRNTNRVTAPDVRRDDQVVIWRLGDSDKYYWEDMHTANVKRLETVIYAFSADPSGPIKGDLSNAYVFQISSHDKQITLNTSKANGEPFAWTVQLNTADGILSAESDGGEEFAIDSSAQHIWAKNAKGTMFELNKNDINAHAMNDVFFKADNNQTYNCKTFTVNATSGVHFNTPKVTCSDELDVGSDTHIGGNTKIDGGLNFTGPGRGEGNISAKTITADESVTAPRLHGQDDD